MSALSLIHIYTEIYETVKSAENGNIVLKAGEHAVIKGLVGGTKIEITENPPGADYFAPVYTCLLYTSQVPWKETRSAFSSKTERI